MDHVGYSRQAQCVGLGEGEMFNFHVPLSCDFDNLRELERSVERRLDATPDTEEVTIPAVLANDHQPDGRTRRP